MVSFYGIQYFVVFRSQIETDHKLKLLSLDCLITVLFILALFSKDESKKGMAIRKLSFESFESAMSLFLFAFFEKLRFVVGYYT